MKKPVDIVPVGNTLGEGVLWDCGSGRAWWTDIQQKKLLRYAPATGLIETFDLPERLGSFGFVESGTQIIAAFESGFALYAPESGALDWIARPPHAAKNIRFNDGRVDRQGRFWAGSMVEGDGEPRGKLYRLDGDGRYEVCAANIAISNSICFSPDGKAMYFADTPKQVIHRYALDPESGELSSRRIFAITPEDAFPDGAQVDCDGCVWSAHWGAGQVVRYTPDGRVDTVIDLPVTQPTCVAFGGDDMDLLFVTSARENLSGRVLERQPQAGNLFVYRVAARGMSDARYVRPLSGRLSE
ncbi:MAG TPA: SMP-30/gluconolactonase/LRE family protein [Rhizomicrobium sp.]|nr:SMP-30/gluconolactonase/LRE family protein [Rhizomicrobium sp.]